MKRLMFFKRMKLTGKLAAAMVLVGLLPLLIASIVNSISASSALSEAALNHLESLRVAKQDQIESYFEQIRNQVVTMSENRMIVEAMQEFSQAIQTLPAELEVSDAQLSRYRSAIADYYSEQFAEEYEAKNSNSIGTASLIPNDASSVVAQYGYIAGNPNPLGSKDVLDAANDGSRYGVAHRKYHPIMRNFLQKFGYYDIFLVDPSSGQIVYSVFKEIDFATSLKSGPYSSTNFAQAYTEALALGPSGEATLVDFEPYIPSYDGPASFIASPIYDGSELVGVLMFQMPVGIINDIMHERSGLGETGETYLVGMDNFMRSQSRFVKDNTILMTEVETAATESIARGETGGDTILDYRGISVMSAFAPLDIAGLSWGIIAEIDEDEALGSIDSLLTASATVAAIALVLVVITAVLFARSLIRPITVAVSVAENIAGGDLDNEIDAVSRCEVGDLLRVLAVMQENLSERINSDRQALAESTRIKQALDNVSGNVMVADVDHNIVYMNQAVSQLFHESETEIRKDIPNFDASQMDRSSIDMFHANPGHQRGILAGLSVEHTFEIRMGGMTMKMVANPVVGADGSRLGTVLELTDRTLELATEQEVQHVVDRALAGDLGERISLDGKSGFFGNLSRGVNELVGVAEQVVDDTLRVFSSMASGDLTQIVKNEYQGSFNELKQDANATIAKLTEVVGLIQASSASVRTGANEISQGNADLSQRTEEQASSLEETASSMEEMTSTVKQNADNAVQANELAKSAREQAEIGGKVVGQAVTAMAEINESSTKISDIIGVIDQIAFQTNLLALNASVEAARAGDQGRGFAVVASEVRNLAGRSATAAKEIKDLIEDSSDKVDEGSRLVNESGETLQEIVNRVKEVTGIVGEIAVASQQQSAGINEVNKAITQMDELTQQNAAVVEEAAAASESLGEQADALNKMMAFFTVEDSGTANGSEASDPPANDERRSAERPWIQPAKFDDVGQIELVSPQRELIVNGGDPEWEEF